MNSSNAASETGDAGPGTTDAEAVPGIPDRVTSLMETLSPSVARNVGSENFAVVSGAVSLFRAVRSFRKGDRKRGLVRAAVGLFWVGVALAQYRRKKGSAGPDATEVADTGPDVEDAVEPGERETEHATGEEVVDTTDADIEESDTAPEVETATDIDRDTAEDVDQRDVVGTTDRGAESETGEGEASSEETDRETDTETDEGEASSEGTDGETDAESGERETDAETGGSTESESAD